MRVKFYGTRGSIPVCEKGYQEFGGNTTCLRILFSSGDIAILDAGSGIRNLGKDLLQAGHQQYDNIFIGFTHFHWDHIQGFPFFLPAYDPLRHFTISAIGKNRKEMDLKNIFETQMQQQYFPVPLQKMGAGISFHQSEADWFINETTMVMTMEHNHPGGAYSYRIEQDGKIFVFCTDIEHGETIDPHVVEFARNADLLVHDAQYTPEELKDRRGWGHSSWQQALEVAERANVKLIALTHHDPDHDDAFLLEVEKQCQARFPRSLLAREGMEVEL